MGHTDIRNNAYGRPCDSSEFGDLSRASHAHLDNRRLMTAVKLEESLGDTDLVIEVLVTGEDGQAGSQRGGHHLLCRGLADASGDSNDRDVKLGAVRTREVP